MSKAHSELSDKCAQEKEIARLEGVAERLAVRKKEKGIESLEHRVAHLQTQLEVQHSEAMQMAAVVKLQGEVEERVLVARGGARGGVVRPTRARRVEGATDSGAGPVRVHLRLRAGALPLAARVRSSLDAKRRFERKARTRATLLSWLSGENDAAHEESMQSMNLQLALAQGGARAHVERERGAARRGVVRTRASRRSIRWRRQGRRRTRGQAVAKTALGGGRLARHPGVTPPQVGGEPGGG